MSVAAQLENIKHYLNSCINVAMIPADRNFSISLFANLLGILMRQLNIFSLYLHSENLLSAQTPKFLFLK